MNELKVPPHSIEIEQSILAALLYFHQETADEIFDSVSPQDFYKTAHQHILSTALELHRAGEPLDAPIMVETFKGKSLLDQIGGASYLAEIMDVPIPPNIETYCRKLRGKAALRRAIQICQKTIHACHHASDAAEVIDAAQREIMHVQSSDSGQAVLIDDLIDDARDRYESLYERQGKTTGVPSFFPDLDTLLSGYQPSDLIILAARPSMGKTAFAVCNLVTMGLRDIPCGIFSLEMSKEQLVDRMTAVSSKVNSLKFRSGRFLDGDWLAITNAFGELQGKPIWIDDTTDPRLSSIRKKARQMVKKGVKVIFIDYLQLLSGANQQNRNLEISEITRGLKLLAKDLNIPIVLLSQLSRKCEERDQKRPRLSDLRDSGAIEQDADVVMFLYRDEVYKPTADNKGFAELIIAKQRNGPTGTIGLNWNEVATRFEPLKIGS